MIKEYLIKICRGEIKSVIPLKLAFHLATFSIWKNGIYFWRNGDEILYIWRWRRKGDKQFKFASVGFTGNGDFGDALFKSLKEIDKAWEDYFASEREYSEKFKNCGDFPCYFEEDDPNKELKDFLKLSEEIKNMPIDNDRMYK